MLRKLIVGITILMLSFAMPATAAEKQGVKDEGKTTASANYPPYPDVWDWEYPIESTETNPALPLRLFMLSNGDVLVSKENKLLFGGQSTSYIPDAFFPLDVTRNRGVVHLNDGTQVSGVKASGDRIKLSNGVEVDSNDNTRLHCYHGPIRNSFHTYDEKKGGYGPNKVIFTILDKPKHYMWDQPRPLPGSDVEVDPCNEEGPPGYTTRVDVVWGGDMLALDDGTFLLPMGNGLIVRFDEHFNTKSPLLNRRFFVFDISFDSNSGRVLSGDIETARVLFIDTINGKKYDLSKTGYQPVYDDLYKHLDNIRRNQP